MDPWEDIESVVAFRRLEEGLAGGGGGGGGRGSRRTVLVGEENAAGGPRGGPDRDRTMAKVVGARGQERVTHVWERPDGGRGQWRRLTDQERERVAENYRDLRRGQANLQDVLAGRPAVPAAAGPGAGGGQPDQPAPPDPDPGPIGWAEQARIDRERRRTDLLPEPSPHAASGGGDNPVILGDGEYREALGEAADPMPAQSDMPPGSPPGGTGLSTEITVLTGIKDDSEYGRVATSKVLTFEDGLLTAAVDGDDVQILDVETVRLGYCADGEWTERDFIVGPEPEEPEEPE